MKFEESCHENDNYEVQNEWNHNEYVPAEFFIILAYCSVWAITESPLYCFVEIICGTE